MEHIIPTKKQINNITNQNIKNFESKRLILIEAVKSHFDIYEYQFTDKRIWTYMYEKYIVQESYAQWVQKLLTLSSKNIDKIFSIYSKQYDEIVGLIRLHNISSKHCKAEIITLIFYNRQNQGFGIESKQILINYAFDVLNLNRIEFYIDINNYKSIKSNIKLGACFEGTLREHMILNNSYKRSSHLFSLLRSEWKNV